MGSSDSKVFGMIMLFLLTLFSYTPLKMELNDIATNATLTNNAFVMLNAVFGYIWILLAVLWVGLAVYYAGKT